MRAQAAVDLMTSYGIALIVIIIAIAVVYRVGLLNPNIVQPECSAVAGFACGLFHINTNGTLTIQLYQSTGGVISVQGIACASELNGTGDKPAFGNIYVTNNTAFYPPNENLTPPVQMYSGSGTTFNVTCYRAGGTAQNNLGAGFFGYLWVNYTLPGYGSTTEMVASLTARYT